MTRATTLSISVIGGALGLFLIACAAGNVVVSSTSPSWACPSPTPKSFGTTGPVKQTIHHTRPITDGGDYDEYIYYEEWEQEYGGIASGPPFPSPTPYGIEGANYTFGQRVAVGPLHVMLGTHAGAIVTDPSYAVNTMQLHYIDITWVNHTATALAINYATQVRLRAVIRPDGRMITDSTWGTSAAAQRIAAITPPTSIPPGTSTATIPVIGPIGNPKIAEFVYLSDPSYVPPDPSNPTVGPGTPTPVPPNAVTPTPNNDLRRTQPNEVAVQFTDAVVNVGPPCSDPGAMTGWQSGTAIAWGRPISIVGVAAPPGADRLVQIAMNQVGKPYVWGSQGPEAFDCSGLMRWSYGQIGLRIPQGTGRSGNHGQWYDMQPVTQDNVKPGDLVFFSIEGLGFVDHVGMLVGDVNGDGKWDMVHAASPKLGVRMDYNIFGSSYYAAKIMGFRTAR